jgi:hypothetical protein
LSRFPTTLSECAPLFSLNDARLSFTKHTEYRANWTECWSFCIWLSTVKHVDVQWRGAKTVKEW